MTDQELEEKFNNIHSWEWNQFDKNAMIFEFKDDDNELSKAVKILSSLGAFLHERDQVIIEIIKMEAAMALLSQIDFVRKGKKCEIQLRKEG